MNINVFDELINLNMETIENYITQKGDINVLDKRKSNMLHYAVRINNYNFAQLLIENKIDINHQDLYGETPLSLAAHMGNFELCELLIKNNANINIQDSKGLSPLHKASYRGKMEIIYLLLSQGAKISLRSENGILPIHMAVRSNKPEIIRLLLDYGASLYEIDNRKNNVLHHAIMYASDEMVKYIIDNCDNINTRNIYKKNPLHLACEKSGRELVSILIQKGVLIESIDIDGFNSLDIAKQFNNFNVYDLLFEVKSNVKHIEYTQKYLLHQAIIKDEYQKALKYINISDINVRDEFGNTPLFYAIINESYVMVKELLNKNASITQVDKAKLSALFYATNTFNLDIIKLLLEAKADVNEEVNGRTPLYRALLSNDIELFELFIKYGANIEWNDPKGKPLRLYAYEYATDDILKYFL